MVFQDVAIVGGFSGEAGAYVGEDGFVDGAEGDLGGGVAGITFEVLGWRFDVEFEDSAFGHVARGDGCTHGPGVFPRCDGRQAHPRIPVEQRGLDKGGVGLGKVEGREGFVGADLDDFR